MPERRYNVIHMSLTVFWHENVCSIEAVGSIFLKDHAKFLQLNMSEKNLVLDGGLFWKSFKKPPAHKLAVR